jgi:methionyl-tRNA synthetase
MDACDLRGGAEAAWELVATANLYIQQVAPWKLAKEARDAELDTALAALARALYRLAVITEPFIPGKAASIRESLGVTASAGAWESLTSPPVGGASTSRPESLFPKPSNV